MCHVWQEQTTDGTEGNFCTNVPLCHVTQRLLAETATFRTTSKIPSMNIRTLCLIGLELPVLDYHGLLVSHELGMLLPHG